MPRLASASVLLSGSMLVRTLQTRNPGPALSGPGSPAGAFEALVAARLDSRPQVAVAPKVYCMKSNCKVYCEFMPACRNPLSTIGSERSIV